MVLSTPIEYSYLNGFMYSWARIGEKFANIPHKNVFWQFMKAIPSGTAMQECR